MIRKKNITHVYLFNIWATQFAAVALVQTTTHQLSTTQLGSTYFYQCFPGSWQFFLDGCRALHHGSKHSLSPTVCLNHMVIHKYLINIELYRNLSKYIDELLVAERLTNIRLTDICLCWCLTQWLLLGDHQFYHWQVIYLTFQFHETFQGMNWWIYFSVFVWGKLLCQFSQWYLYFWF